MTTAFELFLSDEVQSLIDHFAAVLDLRVTFFSVDGRELRRGQHMRNSDYCAMVQQELGTLKESLSMDTAKRTQSAASSTTAATRACAKRSLPCSSMTNWSDS